MAFPLDTYAHVMPGMQSEAAQALAGSVFATDHKKDDETPEQHDIDDNEEGYARERERM